VRLDRFLKVARIIKRRTLAKKVCDRGMVTVNGRPAKASTVLKPGDIVFVCLGSKTYHFEVLKLDEHPPAGLAASLYRPLEAQTGAGAEEEG